MVSNALSQCLSESQQHADIFIEIKMNAATLTSATFSQVASRAGVLFSNALLATQSTVLDCEQYQKQLNRTAVIAVPQMIHQTFDIAESLILQ